MYSTHLVEQCVLERWSMEADTCSSDSQSATGFTLAVLQDIALAACIDCEVRTMADVLPNTHAEEQKIIKMLIF